MVTHSIKAAKEKARILQNYVVELIQDYCGLGDDDVRPALMGESGIDIKISKAARRIFPFGTECKSRDKLDIWQALAQAQINAEKEQLKPLLIFKRPRSKTYAVLEIKDLMDLIRNQRQEEIVDG